MDACSTSTTNEFSSAGQFYAQGFNEVLDVLVNTIKEKLDQETLQQLKGIEEVIISSITGSVLFNVSSPEDLKNRFPILECDINFADLHHELQLLPATFRETYPLIKKVTWNQIVI